MSLTFYPSLIFSKLVKYMRLTENPPWGQREYVLSGGCRMIDYKDIRSHGLSRLCSPGIVVRLEFEPPRWGDGTPPIEGAIVAEGSRRRAYTWLMRVAIALPPEPIIIIIKCSTILNNALHLSENSLPKYVHLQLYVCKYTILALLLY